MVFISIKDMDQDSFYQKIKSYIYFHLESIISFEKDELQSLLDKLRRLKKCHGPNHPSLPSLLHRIVKLFDKFDLLQFSILFLLEQLRVEKFYLSFQHHDLALTLCKIGQTFIKINQLLKAEAYFLEACAILNHHNEKGKLYVHTVYNIGLIKYHKCLYVDAFETFDLALKEQRVSVGETHPDVAQMCLNIGNIKVEVGKLEDALENYLEALMILRMTHGNEHFKICKILHKIGVLHKIRGEYDDGLNTFYQALDATRNLRKKHEFSIIILHEIAQIYQCKEDVTNMIKIFEEIIKMIKLKLGRRHVCVAAVLNLLKNIYSKHGMIERSDITTKEIQDIFSNSSNRSHWNAFADTVVDLFGYAIDDSNQVAAAAAA